MLLEEKLVAKKILSSSDQYVILFNTNASGSNSLVLLINSETYIGFFSESSSRLSQFLYKRQNFPQIPDRALNALVFNSLSDNPQKWSNTLNQFVSCCRIELN